MPRTRHYRRAVSISEELRRLDDRVLGRSPQRSTPRLQFLIGLFGTLLAIAVAIVTGTWTVLGGTVGFLGVRIAGSIGW